VSQRLTAVHDQSIQPEKRKNKSTGLTEKDKRPLSKPKNHTDLDLRKTDRKEQKVESPTNPTQLDR